MHLNLLRPAPHACSVARRLASSSSSGAPQRIGTVCLCACLCPLFPSYTPIESPDFHVILHLTLQCEMDLSTLCSAPHACSVARRLASSSSTGLPQQTGCLCARLSFQCMRQQTHSDPSVFPTSEAACCQLRRFLAFIWTEGGLNGTAKPLEESLTSHAWLCASPGVACVGWSCSVSSI